MSTWERSSPKNETDREIPVERVAGGGPTWRLGALAVATLVMVGTLWAKPWQSDQPTAAFAPTSAPQRSSAGTLAPSTRPRPTPLPVAAREGPLPQCQARDAWRMVTAETSVARDTRTMFAADPQPASGPTDRRLHVSHVYATHLRAVGVCIPVSPVVSPSTLLHQIVLWQVDEDGAASVVDRPELLYSNLYDVGEAYYAPPQDAGPYWPAGRYVFEIKRLMGPESRWMALEFTPTA